jgi:hypothetical protein
MMLLAEENATTFAQAPTRTHQRLPVVLAQVRPFGEQEHFNRATTLSSMTEQACWYNTALVGDQQVAGTQVVAYIAEVAML